MSQDVEELAAEVRFAIYEHDSEYGHREEAVAALDSLLALLRERTEDLTEADGNGVRLLREKQQAERERDALKARVEALEGALWSLRAEGWFASWSEDVRVQQILAVLDRTPTDMPSDRR